MVKTSHRMDTQETIAHHTVLVQQAMHTSELLLPPSILSHRLFNQVHGVLDFQMSFNYGQDINGRASVYI